MAKPNKIKTRLVLISIINASIFLSACSSLPGKQNSSAHVKDGPTKLDLFGLDSKNKKKPKKPLNAKSNSDADTKIRVLPADPEAGIPLTDDNYKSVSTIQDEQQPEVEDFASIKTLPVKDDLIENLADNIPELDFAEDLKDKIEDLEQELANYKNQLDQLNKHVNKQWGKVNNAISDAEKFVKYTNNFASREIADFNAGKVVVETVDDNNPKEKLKNAIVAALLTPMYADNPNLFNADEIKYEGPYLLAGQVLDNEGVAVKWPWRANKFADYLVNNKMQTSYRDGKKVHSVEFDLVENHAQIRGEKYETLVRNASIRYGIPESLIYAIIKVESNFNPYATSHIPAYGLMQVVPKTAGRDVYQKVKKRNGAPTGKMLYNPTTNIDIGTGYLYVLKKYYLKDIRNPQSQKFAIISAYNGGAGNVLRTFSRDRKKAIRIINSLTPQQVYNKLRKNNRSAEARRYIIKVVKAEQGYKSK